MNRQNRYESMLSPLARLGLQAVQHKSGMVAHAGRGANYFHYPNDLLDQIGDISAPLTKLRWTSTMPRSTSLRWIRCTSGGLDKPDRLQNTVEMEP